MKKKYIAFALVITFILGLQFTSVGKAQDIWVFGNDTKNVYVVSESFDCSTLMEPYSVAINAKVVTGSRYDTLIYTFYTWNTEEYRRTTKWWYYATQYMNREDPDLVSDDKSGQAAAILKYCLGRLWRNVFIFIKRG